MRVSQDQVVRVVLHQGDDPWQIAQVFRRTFGLNERAVDTLYEMLCANYDKTCSQPYPSTATKHFPHYDDDFGSNCDDYDQETTPTNSCTRQGKEDSV